MLRKSVIATVIIFIIWAIIDFIVHGFILTGAYSETSQLWRPMEQMSPWLIYLVSIVSACVFTLIYALLIKEKGIPVAIEYGALFGLGAGFSMGYGSYAAMPITAFIAHIWFFSTFIKMVLAGFIVGAIVKE
jgi:hypothetical protein